LRPSLQDSRKTAENDREPELAGLAKRMLILRTERVQFFRRELALALRCVWVTRYLCAFLQDVFDIFEVVLLSEDFDCFSQFLGRKLTERILDQSLCVIVNDNVDFCSGACIRAYISHSLSLKQLRVRAIGLSPLVRLRYQLPEH